MPRSVGVSVGTRGAAPDPDLWDFCGARRRLPAAHAAAVQGLLALLVGQIRGSARVAGWVVLLG